MRRCILKISTKRQRDKKAEEKDHILDKFKDLGTEFLKPVFDALGGETDYENLKIIRLYYLGKEKTRRNHFQRDV
ncbi:MAG: hypothetical protein K8R75_01315 [Deltaproteobacteria bacterium]|nr:hypothetical protein [Deltaproteobacteria bacterium]